MRRYAQVGARVGGWAARMAGEKYLGLSGDKAKQAEGLSAALGGLKGPLMKVAQILSTVPDALPEEYAHRLAELQSNAPEMGRAFVRRRMAAELGADWINRFASFEEKAAAAASLGQVHRAKAHDGRQLACKLQYPDMASVVEADLRQLKLAFRMFHATDGAIDPANIHAELSERLREELDYVRELRHMRLYGVMLKDEKGVRVPEPLPELSTSRLLTMTWLDGVKLTEAVDRPLPERNKLAHNMFRAWYAPFYGYGVIHGDPHLGNYTARPDGVVNLLDFGCIRVFKPSLVAGVIELYHALRTNDTDRAVAAYETWGFTKMDRAVIEVLNIWARFIYAPLMEDKTRRMEETNATVYGRAAARKVHEELRRVGGVRPPREFLLMDRAAIGLGGVFLRLGAEINWHRLFHELIADFDAKALARRQAKALKDVGLT